MLQGSVNPLQGGNPTAAFQQQAGAISRLPIMQKLMSDPGMLDRAAQASPQLRALFSQSPQLAAMMQPGSLQNLLSAAQNPASFQQHIAGKHSACIHDAFAGSCCLAPYITDWGWCMLTTPAVSQVSDAHPFVPMHLPAYMAC